MVEGVPGSSGVTRLTSLDALRGVAALAVVVFHFTFSFDDRGTFPGYPRAVVSFAGGRYGVQLFFVISGFVILWSIQRQSTVGKFAFSRFSRLFPPYWASLLFVSAYILFAQHVLDAGIGPLTFTSGQWFANLTMVPRWIPPFRFHEVDSAYWTLAIEMGFYVLIGVMMVIGLTKKNRIVPAMFVVLVLRPRGERPPLPLRACALGQHHARDRRLLEPLPRRHGALPALSRSANVPSGIARSCG